MNECKGFPNEQEGITFYFWPFGQKRRKVKRSGGQELGDIHMCLAGLTSSQNILQGMFLVGGHTCSWVLGS